MNATPWFDCGVSKITNQCIMDIGQVSFRMILGQEGGQRPHPLEDAGHAWSGKGHWSWLG